MLVISDVSHDAMGPYCAFAAAGSVHHSSTAVQLWYTDPAAAKQQYGPIASWDTSEITDMAWLFDMRADFNDDISRWDVSSVKSMSCMFAGATSFNVDILSWDVSSAREIQGMFNGASSFNRDLSCWEVSEVSNMNRTFCDATSFTHQLTGAWSTRSRTAQKGCMFQNCPGSIAGKTNDAEGTPE